MSEDLSPIATARLASALTLEEAARITGMSTSAFSRVEEHPLEMTLGELKALCCEFNADGRTVLYRWFEGLFGIGS